MAKNIKNKDKIQLNKRVVKVEQDEHKASMICKDGTKYEGDLVIGADGIYREDIVFRDPRNCFHGLKDYKTFEMLTTISLLRRLPNYNLLYDVDCTGDQSAQRRSDSAQISPNGCDRFHCQPSDAPTAANRPYQGVARCRHANLCYRSHIVLPHH